MNLRSFQEMKQENFNPAKVEKHPCTKRIVINKEIHFIWVGTALPKEYYENILSWKKLNPAYRVNLWSTSSPMGEDAYNEIDHFCRMNEITLYDFRKEQLTNLDIVEHILYKEKAQWRFACVSDVLRNSILLKNGGIYIDTDEKNIKPLGDLFFPFGIAYALIKKNTEDFHYSNAFQAVTKEHPIYLIASYIIKKNFEIFSSTNFILGCWKFSKQWSVVNGGVICSFGLAVKDAIEYVKSRNNHFTDLLKDESSIFYLKDFSECHGQEEANWRYGLSRESRKSDDYISAYMSALDAAKKNYYSAESPEISIEECIKCISGLENNSADRSIDQMLVDLRVRTQIVSAQEHQETVTLSANYKKKQEKIDTLCDQSLQNVTIKLNKNSLWADSEGTGLINNNERNKNVPSCFSCTLL